MLQQKVLHAISGVRMSYLLRKLLFRHIGGRTSTHGWQLVVKMAPKRNFILQVRKFFVSFVIYRIHYTSSVSKFEIKSKNNRVCDNRNVFKCVLFVIEFWSGLKSENFVTFLDNYDYTDVCVCLNYCVALLAVHMKRDRNCKDTINHMKGTVRGNPNGVTGNWYVNHCIYLVTNLNVRS
jgi:hypothetical protein